MQRLLKFFDLRSLIDLTVLSCKYNRQLSECLHKKSNVSGIQSKKSHYFLSYFNVH